MCLEKINIIDFVSFLLSFYVIKKKTYHFLLEIRKFKIWVFWKIKKRDLDMRIVKLVYFTKKKKKKDNWKTPYEVNVPNGL